MPAKLFTNIEKQEEGKIKVEIPTKGTPGFG